MRVLILAGLFLVGCESSPAPLPVQPSAPTTAGNMTTVGSQIDKSDSHVAAAVTVARENADKPEVVKAETSVALSYLPRPSDESVALARQRASRADQKDYASAVAFGQKLLAQIDSNWAKMEADQKEAARVSKLKDDRIADLMNEMDRVKQDAAANIWTMTGSGLVVVGGLVCAFVGVRAGAPIILCGAFAGALPFFFGSPYFSIVAGSFLAAVAGLGVWWFYDRVKDSVHESDEQSPPKA